jgi:pimeloyl-ACP methyl ester carboxylesterase
VSVKPRPYRPIAIRTSREHGSVGGAQAERIANRLPDAEVIVFEDSAHLPWLDEPDNFFDTITVGLTRRHLIP